MNQKDTVYTDKILIRPSSLSELFDNPMLWYKKHILSDSTFNGNEATILGTLLHQRIDDYYNGIETEHEKEHNYINEMALKHVIIENEWSFFEELDKMFDAWKYSYNQNFRKPDHTEHQLGIEPKDSIVYINGTVDAIENKTIIDWKTTTKKKSSIGDYWLQLYLYAYLARSNGYEIENVRVCYIQRSKTDSKGKYTAPVVYWYEEEIDETKMKLLIDNLKIVSKKIRFSIDNPDLVELLWNNNLVTWRQ